MSRLNIEAANVYRIRSSAQKVRYDSRLRSQAIASYNTAGAVTYTAADILGGLIVRDPNGAGRTDVLPTAALLVAAVAAAFGSAEVGQRLQVHIINGADAAEAITIQEGTGGGWDANQVSAKTIPQNTSKDVYIELTNVSSGSEAYVAYI